MVEPYDVAKAKQFLENAKREMQEHFSAFFRQPDYIATLRRGDTFPIKGSHVKAVRIIKVADLGNLLYSNGFYVIVSNYPILCNRCTYTFGRQRVAIYRGHSELLQYRVESHLFHDYHVKMKRDKPYSNSLTLNGQPVNIDQLPFSDFEWIVVQHPVTRSTQVVREQMELSFDQVFNRPIASTR